MKNIVLFDTYVGSNNIGDEIIMEAVKKELSDLFDNNYVMSFSTHTPIMHIYQNLCGANPSLMEFIKTADLKILGGTNIIKNNVLSLHSDWNLDVFDIPFYKDVLLVGVGSAVGKKRINRYTKHIYTNIFNKKFIHSTRDEKTKLLLESIGIRAINTGCPTTWKLTREHCAKIPRTKSESVIFTLTDYCQDKKNDQQLIEILKQNYKEIFFWIQGANDYAYFKSFDNIKNIKIISPSLNSYRNVLQHEIDYVGTRLHAGIFALQNHKRSIIISIDNRAEDMDRSIHLNCIKREAISSQLENRIQTDFSTDILINETAINSWKKQFNPNFFN